MFRRPLFLSLALNATPIDPDLLGQLRHLGPVVFTNGVFDVLHRGHATEIKPVEECLAVVIVAALPAGLCGTRIPGTGRLCLEATGLQLLAVACGVVDRSR